MICNRISEDSSKVAIVLMLRGASSQSQGARGTAGTTVASMLWFDEQCFFHGWAEKDVTEYDEVSHILVPCNVLETCTILHNVQVDAIEANSFRLDKLDTLAVGNLLMYMRSTLTVFAEISL